MAEHCRIQIRRFSGNPEQMQQSWARVIKDMLGLALVLRDVGLGYTHTNKHAISQLFSKQLVYEYVAK
jgi:hypothetical protein